MEIFDVFFIICMIVCVYVIIATVAVDMYRSIFPKTSTTHYLKTWCDYYFDVADGRKRFEVRLNDRDYKVGDILVLQCYLPNIKQYLGKSKKYKITYILKDYPAIKEGYVVMSLKRKYF